MGLKLKLSKGYGIKRILLWIIMFLLFFGYESILANGNRIDNPGYYKFFIDIITIFCFLWLILYMLIKGLKKDTSFYVVLVMTVCVMMSMVWNNDFSAGMILKIITVILGYSIINVYGVEDFGRLYVKLMKYLAFFSLITYLCGIFLFPLIQQFPTITLENSVGLTQKSANLGFSFVTYSSELRLRNFGLFREPGVYQAFLNIALIFELFINKNNKNKRNCIIILSLTVLSTLSTSGIICWILIMLCYYSYIDTKDNNGKIYILLIVILILIFVLFFPNVYEMLFSKFNNGASSMYSRMNSIFSNLYVFSQNIIFGVGMTRLDGLLQIYLNNLGLSRYMHNTNTLLTEFSSYGLIFGIIYFSSILKFVNSILYKSNQRFLMALAILVLLFSENFDTTLLFSILIFTGYDIKRKI